MSGGVELELARCDAEIAEICNRADVVAGKAPAWLVYLGLSDWEFEKRLIQEGELLHTNLKQAMAVVARYERFLSALAAEDSALARLGPADFREWTQQAAQDLLDGEEVECPDCCTAVHVGACVGKI